MLCLKCGKENPDDAQICQSCSALLTQAPVTAERPIVKTSGLAIAALVLGILSLFTCGITAIPAVILGIIALVQIGKSGGRVIGKGFAVVGIVVPMVVFLLIIGLIIPAMNRPRQIAPRVVCGTNLLGIGKAMLIYANDYEDELPQAGYPGSTWVAGLPGWKGPTRLQAYGRPPGQVTVSSSLYLLVKYVEVGPKQFVCKYDSGTTEFKPAEYGVRDKDLIDLWDFGPNPSKHCSYSYHAAYNSPFALNVASSQPGMAIAADRNPWIDTPAAKARDFSLFKWDGNTQQQKAGNAITYKGEGQNVLFLDSHVSFEKFPFCGVMDDNIYTAWTDPRGGDRQLGSPPTDGGAVPLTKADSLLVHDPPAADKE